MARAPVNLKALCAAYTEANVRVLAGFSSGPDVPIQYRIQAIGMLLERAYGRPASPHTGENGEGDIKITIRNIIEQKKQTK